MGIASVPPLPRRIWQRGIFQDQGGDTIGESQPLHRIPRPSRLKEGRIRKHRRNVQTNTMVNHLKNPDIRDGGSPNWKEPSQAPPD
ncbi:hypothetical protein NDU88_006460 [Pleurodeles waltl]|uniref:Uncharacterized protein n=1 Tax=Pleurodeles waltl TaxID=8319 RepID=A0AAV7WAN0_PLEWA|nr:hypothetical protein NDU88_006460 [Pleurodeles waltl]